MGSAATKTFSRKRFAIRLTVRHDGGREERTVLSQHARYGLAMKAVTSHLSQWASAPDIVRQGTRLSVVDTDDGGVIFTMVYNGFDNNTILDAVKVFESNGFNLQEVETSDT